LGGFWGDFGERYKLLNILNKKTGANISHADKQNSYFLYIIQLLKPSETWLFGSVFLKYICNYIR